MAHVLLPCDLSFWCDVQKQLSRVMMCRDCGKLVELMTSIHHTCCVSLDPEEDQRPQPHLFRELERFLKDKLSDEERDHIINRTLPKMASMASRLSQLKPACGLFYSLRHEEKKFFLERQLVACLVANAFFSTYPRRNSKTHPTLQDFNFAHFFRHLDKRAHQKRLLALFHYFETHDERRGTVHFSRKMVKGPSLPGWLCSDGPLLPLRTEKDPSHSRTLQACFCNSLIGGDVLKASTSEEAALFFTYPELLVILCFVESLSDSEVLIVDNIQQVDSESPRLNFYFSNFVNCTNHRIEDQFLLRELNKALAAFHEETETRTNSFFRHCSKSSSLTEDLSFEDRKHSKDTSSGERKRSKDSSLEDRSLSGAVSFGERSISRKSDSFDRNISGRSYSGEKSVSFEIVSKDVQLRQWSLCKKGNSMEGIFAKNKRKESLDGDRKLAPARSSSHSSGRSMKTASPQLKEEDYYTADDDSEEGNGRLSQRGSRSGSVGFVLGEHERLDDFRKRIRKRTRRRLSRRRSSSSSYLSSSSDMEDISEEIPDGTRFIRVATSEPSLLHAVEAQEQRVLSSEAAEALMTHNRKMMVMSSDGRLKAYSYDGVNPNLPVPFKAKFRHRKIQDSMVPERRVILLPPEDCQLRLIIQWLAASMAEAELCVVQCPEEQKLQEISTVYLKVLSRGWTIGDLSCEVLRFCRNTLLTHSRTDLFTQLTGGDVLRQPSLD